jgi:hypothetical protein
MLTRNATASGLLLGNNSQFNGLNHFSVQLNVDLVLTDFTQYALWQANF